MLKKMDLISDMADKHFMKINGSRDLVAMDEYLKYVGGVPGAVGIGTVAAASCYYLATRPTPLATPFPMDHQSIELPGPERIRVSKLAQDGKFMRYMYEDGKTLYEVFRRGARVSNNGPALGWHDKPQDPYSWIHYDTAIQRMQNFGSGLIYMGLQPTTTTFVGIYALNCPEWIITEYTCYTYSMVIVPLYDTLGPESCNYILNQTEITTTVCDTEDRVKGLLENASSTKSLIRIVHIKPVSAETLKLAKLKDVELVSMADVEKLGADHPHAPVPPKPKDLSTICYTSGTTGNPKGAMLSHENMVSSQAATCFQMGSVRPQKDDVMLSFLPLAHVLERCCQVAVYVEGGGIGFYGGDIKNLIDDLKMLRPTIMVTVPRLLNRIYDKVKGTVEGSLIKSTLFNMALHSKEADVNRRVLRNTTVWDKLVFRRVQEGLGGRLRLMLVGSAPLSGNVLTFMRCALGCVVVEGYGQTECAAPCAVTVQGDPIPDHVGPPLPCCHLKVVDVPEMEYWASENKGEVCIKGANVFMGYLKDPQKTNETLDTDGWLHTGDIGMWMPNGTLRIVDRKKHIFKLAQGEYIAPEKIENIYVRSTPVAQVFVHGESLKSCLVAIVVPDPEWVKRWAAEKGVEYNSLTEICANAQLKKDIMEDMFTLGKKSGLKSFEQVKDIYVSPEAFTVENNLMTPTMKTKRPDCKKFFQPQIEEMYSVLA